MTAPATGRATGPRPGPANQLLSDATYTYAYDNDGNLTSRTNKSSRAVTQYTWDYRNRLTQVEDCSTGKTITYAYDVFDRLVSRALDPNGTGQNVTTTYYVYDGQNAVLELNSAGAVQERFLYGRAVESGSQVAERCRRATGRPISGAVDKVLAAESGSGNVRWYLADNEGTVRDVAAYSSGTTTVVDHLKYDAYGNIVWQTNSAEQPQFAYTGQFWDADAGLYYCRGRWYNPGTGQFLNRDPLGFAGGGTNLQDYVLNDPTNATDPDGTCPCGVATSPPVRTMAARPRSRGSSGSPGTTPSCSTT